MKNRTMIKNIVGYAFLVLVVAGFFWLAGRWDWIAGWVYVAVFTVGVIVQTLYVRSKDPEVIRRREELGTGTQKWDFVLLTIFMLTFLAILVVGALDAGRFQWSTMPWWLWFIGLALMLIHFWIMAWSMAENTFFEKTVRIQDDRDHRVVDTGPYKYVRHPGYSCSIVGFVLGTPFMLGSWWAFVPAGIMAVTMIIRTSMEDRFLQRELEGYKEYTQRTRYRLFPGIW